MRSAAVAQNFPRSKGMAGAQQRIGLSKSYTVADFATNWGRALEAKFGNSAVLSRAQRLASRELGPFFRPDQWLPRDIGNFSGGWLGPVAAQWVPKADDTP